MTGSRPEGGRGRRWGRGVVGRRWGPVLLVLAGARRVPEKRLAGWRSAAGRASEPQGLRTGLPLSPPSPGGRRRPRTGKVACELPLAPAGQARAPALSRPPGPILLGVLLLLALQFPRDKPGCPFTFAMVAGGQVGSGRPSARPFASGRLSPALAVPHSRHSANARLLSSSLAQVIKTRS